MEHNMKPVIPAQAGIHLEDQLNYWIPACAGMTKNCSVSFPTTIFLGIES